MHLKISNMYRRHQCKYYIYSWGNRHFSNLKGKQKTPKFEKSTKFKNDLYKFHSEQYRDDASTRPNLYLKDVEDKKNHDDRVKRNIPLIYNNEVHNLEELKKNPFTLVNVKNMNNDSFGVATFNPYALITARIINQNVLFSINVYFFMEKIRNALEWRKRMNVPTDGKIFEHEKEKVYSHNQNENYNENFSKKIKETENNNKENSMPIPRLNDNHCYRLVNTEGDYVPGLIIDRYDTYIVIQHLTLGCEMLACTINDAIKELLKPKAIIFRNDNKERLNEKLELYKKVPFGNVPEHVLLKENNCSFKIDLINSPNTGWFFNRKNVRSLICEYAYQKSILDVFCYVGSFGIQCSRIGKAKQVTCVDKDEKFIQLAKETAEINNVYNVEFVCSDAIEFFKECKQLFDIIIIDPPNLIPKSQFLQSGSNRYKELINVAQNFVTKNGLLLIIFTSKLCSYQDYINIINDAFLDTKKIHKIVGQGRGPTDHPVNLSLYMYSDFYWFLLQIMY